MTRRTLLVGVVGVAALAGCCTTDPRSSDPDAPEAVSSASTTRPSRCQRLGREETIGQQSGDGGYLDEILPFATEVGDGVAFAGGFAVGALRQVGKGTGSIVVTANQDGTAWRVVPLADSHGDADAPQVFARGDRLGAALLEPSGASRTLRLARIDRDAVKWGAEFLQGHDESLAYDVLLGERVGVAVWDDVPKDRDVSAIYLATFDPKSLTVMRAAKTVTLPGTDGEMPRLVERPGGFWLFWLARRPGPKRSDERYSAEEIAYRWLEVVPLDAEGSVSGAPIQLGSNTGHVLAYDVAAMSDGAAVVMWRDDDTPSGSAGGQLFRVRVRLGGVDGPDSIESEHNSIGAPNVMPGWYAIADSLVPTRLAPMNADGSLGDLLASEELLGAGEPVANHEDRLFISRPDGVAVRLFVAKCSRQLIDGGAPTVDAEP